MHSQLELQYLIESYTQSLGKDIAKLSKKQKTLLTDVRAAGLAMDAFAEGEEEEGDYDDEGEEVKANDDPERVPEAAASAPAAAAEATEATASAPMCWAPRKRGSIAFS